MTLAIFDLDHTLLDGDSDYLWGEYMVENGIVDEAAFRERNRQFYADYQRGELDNETYLRFALEPLTRHSREALYRWRADYVETWIRPLIVPGAPALLDRHRAQGHELMIISATHRFITEPIAQLLDIPNLISTEPEIVDDRYSGRYSGIVTYREGKVAALQEWIEQHGHGLDGSYFYSDSINDLAMLELVDNPVVVHPDERLGQIATERNWPVLDLR